MELCQPWKCDKADSLLIFNLTVFGQNVVLSLQIRNGSSESTIVSALTPAISLDVMAQACWCMQIYTGQKQQ